MKNRFLYASLYCLLLLFFLNSSVHSQSRKGCKKIEKGLYKKDYDRYRISTRVGPEDLVLDTLTKEGPRLIMGSAEYRKKKKYHADQHQGSILFQPLYDDEATPEPFKLNGYSDEDFHPHGLCVAQINEKPYLFVISHEQKNTVHKIIQFEITGNTLTFVKAYSSEQIPEISSPNDLFVTSDGSIYFTNPGKLTLWTAIFKKRKGHIGYISPEGKAKKLIAGLIYPNGILVHQQELFITTTMTNELQRYKLAGPGKLTGDQMKVLAKIKGGDNISITGNTLYIAHHPKKLRFSFYANNNGKSPSRVTSYDLHTNFCQQVFISNGKLLSGSSTAVYYDNHLYVTQVILGYFVQIPQERLQSCRCKPVK